MWYIHIPLCLRGLIKMLYIIIFVSRYTYLEAEILQVVARCSLMAAYLFTWDKLPASSGTIPVEEQACYSKR